MKGRTYKNSQAMKLKINRNSPRIGDELKDYTRSLEAITNIKFQENNKGMQDIIETLFISIQQFTEENESRMKEKHGIVEI